MKVIKEITWNDLVTMQLTDLTLEARLEHSVRRFEVERKDNVYLHIIIHPKIRTCLWKRSSKWKPLEEEWRADDLRSITLIENTFKACLMNDGSLRIYFKKDLII